MPSREVYGFISYKTDLFVLLLSVQGIISNLCQHHSSKASIFLRSLFLIVQLSQLYIITGKTNTFTSRTFVSTDTALSFMTLNRPFIHPIAIRLAISDVQPPFLSIFAPIIVKLSTTSYVSSSAENSSNSPNVNFTFVFFTFSQRSDFSMSSFTPFQISLRSSSASASSVASSTYRRLVIFRPPILPHQGQHSQLYFTVHIEYIW